MAVQALSDVMDLAREDDYTNIAVQFFQLIAPRNLLTKDIKLLQASSLTFGKIINLAASQVVELAEQELKWSIQTVKSD